MERLDAMTSCKVFKDYLALAKIGLIQIASALKHLGQGHQDRSRWQRDAEATVGADILPFGFPNQSSLIHLLKGNVEAEVARNLPDNIQLVIHG